MRFFVGILNGNKEIREDEGNLLVVVAVRQQQPLPSSKDKLRWRRRRRRREEVKEQWDFFCLANVNFGSTPKVYSLHSLFWWGGTKIVEPCQRKSLAIFGRKFMIFNHRERAEFLAAKRAYAKPVSGCGYVPNMRCLSVRLRASEKREQTTLYLNKYQSGLPPQKVIYSNMLHFCPHLFHLPERAAKRVSGRATTTTTNGNHACEVGKQGPHMGS